MSAKANKSLKSKSQVKPWQIYLLFTVLAFVFYGKSINNKYSMDDDLVTTVYDYPDKGEPILVSRHKNVEKGIAGIPAIFTSHYAQNKKQSYDYRPVVTSTFAIEYQFFGSNPAVSHGINILLYALTVILVFRFIGVLLPRSDIWLAGLISLLFLVHPIHSEVINNIKSRDELLCLIFGISSILRLIKYVDSRKLIHLVLSILFVMFSFLCKKTGMVFVPVAILSIYFFRDFKLKQLLVIVSLFTVSFFVWKLMAKGLVQKSVLREMGYFENPLYFSDSIADRFPMFFYSLGYYIKLLLFPFPFRYYYGFDQVSIATWANVSVWVVLISLVGALAIIVKRIKKKEIWAFGVLFFLLGIGGACNLLFPAVGIIAERFAFTASVGFSISVGWLLYILMKKAKDNSSKIPFHLNMGLKVLVASGVIVSIIVVNQRNGDWETRKDLYVNDMKYLGKSAKAHSLLGQLYAKEVKAMHAKMSKSQGQNQALYREYNAALDSAIFHFNACLEIYPEYHVSANNLGAMYYLFKGDTEKARENFQLAVDLDSTYVEANFNLANAIVWEYEKNKSLLEILNTISYPQTPKSPKNDFTEKYKDLRIGMARFDANSKKALNQIAKQSKDFSTFLSSLTKNVSSGTKQFGVEGLYNEAKFNADVISQADTLQKLARTGQMVTHIHGMIRSHLGNNLYTKILKGKYSVPALKSEVMEIRDNSKKQFLYYVNKAGALDPTYVAVYTRLTQFHTDEREFDKVIEVNQAALEVEGFEYYYSFHMKIGNAYMSKSDVKSAIQPFEDAASEFSRHLADLKNDNALDNKQKRQIMQSIKMQYKQLCLNLEGLCGQTRDFKKAAKYKKMAESL